MHGRAKHCWPSLRAKTKTNQNMFYFWCVNASSMTIIDNFYINGKRIFSSFIWCKDWRCRSYESKDITQNMQSSNIVWFFHTTQLSQFSHKRSSTQTYTANTVQTLQPKGFHTSSETSFSPLSSRTKNIMHPCLCRTTHKQTQHMVEPRFLIACDLLCERHRKQIKTCFTFDVWMRVQWTTYTFLVRH